MLDIRKLKELVRLMVAHDLSEIDLRDSEEQVTIRRTNHAAAPVVAREPAHPLAAAPMAAGTAVVAAPASNADSGLLAIESPMVGTFYLRPDPDTPAFAPVGASIGPESIICLVEAMKIFNEIKSGVGGTVEKVLVKNGEAVEFGQKLFMVRPG